MTLIRTVDEEDDTNAAPAKPTQLAQLDALIARLPTLGNRDLIDAAAVEFCYINSKAARKRLVKVRYIDNHDLTHLYSHG